MTSISRNNEQQTVRDLWLSIIIIIIIIIIIALTPRRLTLTTAQSTGSIDSCYSSWQAMTDSNATCQHSPSVAYGHEQMTTITLQSCTSMYRMHPQVFLF